MDIRQRKLNQFEQATRSAFEDVTQLLNPEQREEMGISGEQLIVALRKNFSRLDPDNNGITRIELMTALMSPAAFTPDEYAMLRLITRYFDTIINMADDEPGEESRITRLDFDVLSQFLLHSNVTLSMLERWLDGKPDEKDIGPPPIGV